MLFNSITFAIFLPIVFLIYWAIGYARIKDSLKLRMQNAFVLLASYVFYGWWDWRFLGLIALTSFLSWGTGLLIHKSRESRVESGREEEALSTLNTKHSTKQRLWLAANIVINLGILAIFKYYDFFVTEFCGMFGIDASHHLLNILLPVGISFYTFQALSYSIDVYRGKIAPTKDIVAFFAYVAFFPQLVAGPIERATNLLPQFEKNRTFDYDQAVDGCRRILWGLFKKIVIADNCATYVNQVWADYASQSGSTLALAAILFTFQIYGDFSGYSDIAIGTAKLFGINLMDNFRMPYFSRNVAEFWKRWHISLNTWFVDYVYIPLGGSRPVIDKSGEIRDESGEIRDESGEIRDESGEIRDESGERRGESRKKLIIIRNVFVVFLLSGLWHGANWTYVGWGAYHALLFVPLIFLGTTKKYRDTPSLRQLPQMLLTFALVVLGWILFRAPSIADAWAYLCGICDSSLFTLPSFATDHTLWVTVAMIAAMFGFEWHYRRSNAAPLPRSPWVYVPLIALIWWFAGQNSLNFIYFQF